MIVTVGLGLGVTEIQKARPRSPPEVLELGHVLSGTPVLPPGDVPVDAVVLFSFLFFCECFSWAFLSRGALITKGPVPNVLCINTEGNK